MISNDSESTEENIYIILYIFTMWPYWPTLKQLNPLPRGHGFHNSGRSLHGNHIHVISFMPPPLYKNKSPCHKWGWEGKWWLSIHIFRQHTEFNMPAMLLFWLYIMKYMENDFLFTLMTLQF